MFTSSIKFRIVIALLLPMLLIGGILLYFVISENRQLMAGFNDKKMADQLEAYAVDVTGVIQDAEADSLSIKRYAETVFLPAFQSSTEAVPGQSEATLDKFHDFLYNLSTSHKDMTYFVYFMPQGDNLPESFGYGDYNSDGRSDPMPQLPKTYFTQGTLDQDKQWFFNALKSGQSHWFGPYSKFLGVEDNILMTYSTPVYQGNSIVAVVGVDIPLSSISRQLSLMSYHNAGYVSLMDKRLRFISHPTLRPGQTITEQLGPDYAKIEAVLRDSQSGQLSYEWFDQKQKVLIFKTLHNDWKLVLTAYQDEVFFQTHQLNQSLSVLFIVSVLGVTAFSTLFGSWISQPFIQLSEALGKSQEMGRLITGRLALRTDEIGQLTRLLKARYQLSENYLKSLNHYNVNLGKMVAERNEALIRANGELAEKREQIQARQQALRLQNDRLEASIQSMVATQSQLIEQEKIASFSDIIAKVSEEIRPALSSAKTLIREMDFAILNLTRKMLMSEYSRSSFVETYETAQKNNRRLLRYLIFSKDIIDYVKDLGSDKHFRQIAMIELTDYLNKAGHTLNTIPQELPVQLTLIQKEPVFLKIDAGKFLHIVESLLIHRVVASNQAGQAIELTLSCQTKGRDLYLRISDSLLSSADEGPGFARSAGNAPLASDGPTSVTNDTSVPLSVNTSVPITVDTSVSISTDMPAGMGLSMIDLLMKEAFGGALTEEHAAKGAQNTYVLYFPKVIVDANGEPLKESAAEY